MSLKDINKVSLKDINKVSLDDINKSIDMMLMAFSAHCMTHQVADKVYDFSKDIEKLDDIGRNKSWLCDKGNIDIPRLYIANIIAQYTRLINFEVYDLLRDNSKKVRGVVENVERYGHYSLPCHKLDYPAGNISNLFCYICQPEQVGIVQPFEKIKVEGNFCNFWYNHSVYFRMCEYNR